MTEDAAVLAADGVWRRPPRWRSWELGAIAAVVLLGLVLRLHHYTRAPVMSDNQDEVAWAWSGLTLLTTHVPYAWSLLPSYHDARELRANGTSYRIVHPWVDDPPLFSVVIGAEAWLRGARDLRDVTLSMIRPAVVALSSLSILLLYLLGRRLLPQGAALVGAALLATAPAAVLFGRVVESENLLAPLLLAALILTHRLLTGEGGRVAVAGLALCCVAASLTKVPGLSVAIACGAVLLLSGRWRAGFLVFGSGVLGLLLYAAYGAILDWQAFTGVISAQASRRHGLLAGYQFIVASAGIGLGLRDGWWVLGWIGVGTLMLSRAAVRLLPWAALVFVGVILLLADERVIAFYGWYRIPIYPVIYAAAGYLFWVAVKEVAIAPMVAVLLLGGASAVSFGLTGVPDEWMPSALIVGIVLAVVLLPVLLAEMRRQSMATRQVAQAISLAALLIILALNVVESYNLDRIYRVL